MTVAVPPGGSVNVPAIVVVPTPESVVVTVPPGLDLIEALVIVPNPLGSESENVADVAVDGPEFVMINEKVSVPPALGARLLAVLVMPRSDDGVTVSCAVVTDELVPTEVEREPAGMVFVTVPPTTLVTTTVAVQTDAGGINVPAANVKVPSPTVAVTVPKQLVWTFGTGAFTTPNGYESVKTDASVADVNACVLMIEIVNNDVPPAMMRLGLNVLVTTGGEVFTGSESADKHPAAVQPATKFVLTTPLGAEMTAVLVTRL